jgi:hypothetical protein
MSGSLTRLARHASDAGVLHLSDHARSDTNDSTMPGHNQCSRPNLRNPMNTIWLNLAVALLWCTIRLEQRLVARASVDWRSCLLLCTTNDWHVDAATYRDALADADPRGARAIGLLHRPVAPNRTRLTLRCGCGSRLYSASVASFAGVAQNASSRVTTMYGCQTTFPRRGAWIPR